eukprot:8094383-Pyramimonas_sp.AAC.1
MLLEESVRLQPFRFLSARIPLKTPFGVEDSHESAPPFNSVSKPCVYQSFFAPLPLASRRAYGIPPRTGSEQSRRPQVVVAPVIWRGLLSPRVSEHAVKNATMQRLDTRLKK